MMSPNPRKKPIPIRMRNDIGFDSFRAEQKLLQINRQNSSTAYCFIRSDRKSAEKSADFLILYDF